MIRLSNEVKLWYWGYKQYHILEKYIWKNEPMLAMDVFYMETRSCTGYLEKMQKIIEVIGKKDAKARMILSTALTEQLGFTVAQAQNILQGNYLAVLEEKCAFEQTTPLVVNVSELTRTELLLSEIFSHLSIAQLVDLLPDEYSDAMFYGSDPLLEEMTNCENPPSRACDVSLDRLPQLMPIAYHHRANMDIDFYLQTVGRILRGEVAEDEDIRSMYRNALLYALRVYCWGKDRWRKDVITRDALTVNEQLVYDAFVLHYDTAFETWGVPEHEMHPILWLPLNIEETMALRQGSYATIIPWKVRARCNELGVEYMNTLKASAEPGLGEVIAEKLPRLNEKIVMHCRFRGMMSIPAFLTSPDTSRPIEEQAQQSMDYVLSHLHPGDALLRHILTRDLNLAPSLAETLLVKGGLIDLLNRMRARHILSGVWGRP